MLILDRCYHLLDRERQVYTEARYHRTFRRERLQFTGKTTPFAYLQDLASQYLRDGELPAFADNPLVKLFWKWANEEARLALLFSYHQHVTEGCRKMPNIEIDPWIGAPFFRQFYERLRGQIGLLPLRDLGAVWRAYLATSGKHFRALRLGNVHLGEDIVEGRPLFSIHWDIHVSGSSPWSLIKHWLLEDIAS